MGTVRTFLALSVVLWHVGYWTAPVTGETAVTCFYMISGFYMAMVLNTSYLSGGVWKWRFYASRMLRLYPTYLVVLAFALIVTLKSEGPNHVFNLDRAFNPFGWLAIAVANLSIWGLDLLNFISKADLLTNQRIVRLIGPAWTLAIELQFYAVAPFIVTRSLKFLIATLLIMLGLHFSLVGLPLEWRYYLPPAAWCFFLLGSLSYRLHRSVFDSVARQRVGMALLAAVPILAVFARVWVNPDIDQPSMWLFYAAFAACIPFLFDLTKAARVDNWFGNLSYPVYLVHRPIIALFALALGGNENEIQKLGLLPCIGIIVAVFAASLALYYGLEQPIDRYRGRFRSGKISAAATNAALAPSA